MVTFRGQKECSKKKSKGMLQVEVQNRQSLKGCLPKSPFAIRADDFMLGPV